MAAYVMAPGPTGNGCNNWGEVKRGREFAGTGPKHKSPNGVGRVGGKPVADQEPRVP